MKRLGPVIEKRDNILVYEVPRNSTKVLINPASHEIFFKQEEQTSTPAQVTEEYQYNAGDRWVRVTPKKSPGPFKGIKKIGE